MTAHLRILCISGSLRSNSYNTSLLKALIPLAPSETQFVFYEGLEDIPPFHPDKATDSNAAVEDFRKQLSGADAVIICTPEYAFGVPGVLKNALDWTVGTAEFNEKPVAAISASPLSSGGDKALESLGHTLTALGTLKNEHTVLSIPMVKKKLTAQGELIDQDTLEQMKQLLYHLFSLVESKQK